MTIQRITFEIRGQEFHWWEIDASTGRIVGCGPRQAGLWANGHCSVDMATIEVGKRPTFFGPATEPQGRTLGYRIVDIAPAQTGGGGRSMTDFSTCPSCGGPIPQPSPQEIGELITMPRLQRRIFDLLVQRFGRWVSMLAVIDAMYSDDLNGGPDAAHSTANVHITYLRNRLRHTGLIVEGRKDARRMVWGPR